jgi:hypothetical protein
MSPLAPLARKAVAFFVDDAFLGAAIVATVTAASLCRILMGGRPLLAGALLAGGCLVALTLSVARAAAAPQPKAGDSGPRRDR